jgi:L-alanine-DL-glutamate epimerase-like enolase superfamily enzyme
MTRSEAPVSAVRAAAFRVPTDAPEADGTLAWDGATLVTVEIEAGCATGFGYGYADRAAAQAIMETLAPRLQGREALDVPARWRDMVDVCRNHGLRGAAAMAVSICDAALHDLRGKLLDAPVCRLLGRRTESVAVYGSGGFTSYGLPQLEGQLAGWVAQGFSAVKMKIGGDPARAAERVRAARRTVGEEIALMIDANGAYAPKAALDMAARAAHEGVVWFEEPVSSDDVAGLRLVREQGPPGLDVAAGEYGWDVTHFRDLLAGEAVDVLQADATRCLGLTGFLHADALAWAHQRPLSAHCAPALHLHVACACQRLIHVEWFHDHARIEAMLLDGAPEPRDGRIAPDLSRSGLGLALKGPDAERFKVWGSA